MSNHFPFQLTMRSGVAATNDNVIGHFQDTRTAILCGKFLMIMDGDDNPEYSDFDVVDTRIQQARTPKQIEQTLAWLDSLRDSAQRHTKRLETVARSLCITASVNPDEIQSCETNRVTEHWPAWEGYVNEAEAILIALDKLS